MKTLLDRSALYVDVFKTRAIKPLQYHFSKITTIKDFAGAEGARDSISGKLYYWQGTQKLWQELAQGTCVFWHYAASENGRFGRKQVVECGEEWRKFMTEVYSARTDQEYREANPLYKYALVHNAEMDRRKALMKSRAAKIQEIEAKRLAYVTRAQKADDAEYDAIMAKRKAYIAEAKGEDVAALQRNEVADSQPSGGFSFFSEAHEKRRRYPHDCGSLCRKDRG